MSLDSKNFKVTAVAEIFPLPAGWVFVRVPKSQTVEFSKIFNRGLVPIKVTLGLTNWDTSLLPMGDGTHFIPLKEQVRKKESIKIGDKVALTYRLRGR